MDSILRINKWDCPEIWSLQYLIFSKAECCGSKIVMIQFHYNVNVYLITMAYSRFHHQNTVTGVSIKRSPKSEWTATKYNVCSKMWHAKGQNATKCDIMMSHSVIFCLILSYFVTLCCVSLHYVKFCRCSLRGDLWNLEFGQILSTSFWRMKVLKIFEISDNLLWNRWNFWVNFWDQWKFSANFSDRWTFWANFWDQWKFWANFWDRSDFVDKFLDRWKFW